MNRRTPLTPYLFIFPSAAIFLLFIVWPALQGFYQSLFRRGVIVRNDIPALAAEFVGLGNFRQLLHDERFLAVLGRTIVYTSVTVPLVVLVALGLALLLRDTFPGVGIVRAIVYWPSMVSLIIVGISWKWILGFESGVANYLMTQLGLAKVPWLLDPTIALATVVLVSVWATAGFFMVIFIAGLNAIPDVYYESATIDGCGSLQLFRHITAPLLKPTTVLVVILATINAFKVFEQVIVLTDGGPGRATVFMVQNIYEEAFRHPFGVGYASAQSVVFFFIMLLFAFVQFRMTRGGEA